MTMHHGLMDQSQKFKKTIASKDLSSYKVVKRGQLVVSFPIDEGVLDFQQLYDAAIVSPAYGIWDLIDPSIVDINYLGLALRSPRSLAYYKAKLQGSTARRRTLPKEVFLAMPVELPNIEEQKRRVLQTNLEKLIEQKRARQRELLSELEKSVFHQMFGNPFEKNDEHPRYKLSDISLKFSDGPFGSNLKSEHYQTNGIRVIRLQNIGVGKFKDKDKVFISSIHYEKLKKYTCSPGDIIIATLGNPNLRAAEIPDYIDTSINKADCIQIRPNLNLVNPQWLICLLNDDSTNSVLSTLFHGQTRSRVSMGQLKNLEINLPPLSLQNKFEKITKNLTI